MTRVPVESILRAMRRRMWFERMLLKLRLGVWIGSLFLLVIAVISAVWFPVAPFHAALAAVAVVIVVMLSALSQRPTLKECALRADRQFVTDSLLTTALEISASAAPEIPAAGCVVLQQANDAAPRLQEHLHSAWQAPAPSGFALATIPVFASALLLSLSAYQDGSVSAIGLGAESVAVDNLGESFLDDGDELLALRESIGHDSTIHREANSGEGPAANGNTMTPDNAATRGNDQQVEIAESKAAATGLGIESPAGGREAGDSRAAAHENGSAPVSVGPLFAERSEVQIARYGDSVAGSEASDAEFGATASAPAPNPARVRPAAAPPTLSSWTTLTPAQVAYARQYLDRMKTQRE